jgi:hypothetical protein
MNIQSRLTGLVTDPKKEWSIIATESKDIPTLYREFILIVAAVPAAAMLLRLTIGGAPSIGLSAAVSGYLVSIAHPILGALVLEKLAPKFQSRGTTAQALALVAYSSAPVWAAGALLIVPGLGWLATLAGVLYAIYLFWLGLPIVLHTPREQIVPFMVVSAIVMLVINLILSFLLSRSRLYGW